MSASANSGAIRSRSANSTQRWTEAHPYICFAFLSIVYIVLVWTSAQRPLWYDELFTFYIAQQPTVARLMAALHTIDLNPPLNYFLTRWSIATFGAKPWATRLPEMVAFWIGSLAVFHLLRRRATTLIAAIGVLLLWSTPYFSYSTEARPYGILLGFTAVLLDAWDAASAGKRRFDLFVVAISGVILLLSHVFGVLSLGAVWVGEIVRSIRRKSADPAMVFALLIPLVACFTYGPLFHSETAIVFPPEAAVTWGKLYYLYFSIFRWMWRPLVALGIIALLSVKRAQVPVLANENAPALRTVLGLFFLVPLGLTLVFLRSHGAFYDRYGMVAVLPIVVLTPLLVDRRIPRESSAQAWSFVTVGLLLLASTVLRFPIQTSADAVLPPTAAKKLTGVFQTSTHGPFRPWFKNLAVPPSLLEQRADAPLIPSLDGFHPDLPIVAASELTFFEMDQREGDSVARRLYYLYDREAELQIAHRSITDGVLNARAFFPARSNVAAYAAFVSQHRQFLVIGTYEHPGDWLLRKATLDGATLQIVARYEGYADTDIYLVSYPGS